MYFISILLNLFGNNNPVCRVQITLSLVGCSVFSYKTLEVSTTDITFLIVWTYIKS